MATSTTIKYDTYDNWSTSNPVLSSGEVSIDTTNDKAKIGDGTTKWNDLPYSTTDIATAILDQTKNLTLASGTELVTSSLSYNPMTNDLKVGTDGNGIVTARRFEGTAKNSDTANGVPVYDTDPVGTRVGQIYFNSNYGELRTCTNVANNTWESVRTITAKMWATSGTSPDVLVDDDSPTGYTQSSKSWALYSKTKAQESETSATNAKISETNASKSATSAENSNQSANRWAVATDSPDGTTDTDSSTGKTQSAKSWALLAKASADSAKNHLDEINRPVYYLDSEGYLCEKVFVEVTE